MRKLFLSLVFMAALAGFLLNPAAGHCGWVLYDNFDSDSINPLLWAVDNSSASISVVNGKVKFVHKAGFAGDPSYLAVKNASSIKGVRAKVYVVSATGDLKARIAGFVGTTAAGKIVRQQITVLPSSKKIAGAVDAYSGTEWLYNFFWTDFKSPIKVTGKWFTLTEDLSALPKVTFTVAGQGTSTFKLPVSAPVQSPYTHLLETRSTDGSGAGTVYFDEVYVLK